MKKIIYISIIAIVATYLLPSCTNLESERYDIITPGIFPKTEEDAEALVVAAAYSPFKPDAYNPDGIFHTTYAGYQVYTDMTTDLSDCQWTSSEWNPAKSFDFKPTLTGLIQFYGHRKNVSRMTNTLATIADIPMSEEAAKRMNAELHLGRGWLSFLLYSLYGPIPTATLEDLENPLGDKVIPRPTKEWMVDFIEKELKDAAKDLPAAYEANSQNYGRFTRGLAYTVLMKLYMHEKRWSEAVAAGRELMKAEYGYSLVPRYKDIFTLENEKNSEIIWAIQCQRGSQQNMWHAHVLPGEYITQNPAITKWSGYRMPWHFYNTFDKKDQRLEVIVAEFTDKNGITYNEANSNTYAPLAKGALPVKYGEDPESTGTLSQVDWIIYRYADVLTLLSEAIVRDGGAVTQEALDLLNRVRTRAGLDAYTLSDIKDVDDFYEKVLQERGHELWNEGCRMGDLIRHGKYIEYARKYKTPTNPEIAKDEYVLWPIPQTAIDESKGQVIQNPGY